MQKKENKKISMTRNHRNRRNSALKLLQDQADKLQKLIKNINIESNDDYIKYIKSKFKNMNKPAEKIQKLIDIKLIDIDILKKRI